MSNRVIYVLLSIVGAVVLTQGPDWWGPSGTPLSNVVGLMFILVALYLAFNDKTVPSVIVADPPHAKFLFDDLRSAPLWLPFRVFAGMDFLLAGYHKLTDPKWLVTGESLLGFWQRAVTPGPTGATPAPYPWFVAFLQLLIDSNSVVWFKYVIIFGELAVGLGLVLGVLTGVAAFGGSLMNLSFSFAGSVSTNPLLFAMEAALVLGWKVAGHIGGDRWLLPKLGTPWGKVEVLAGRQSSRRTTRATSTA